MVNNNNIPETGYNCNVSCPDFVHLPEVVGKGDHELDKLLCLPLVHVVQAGVGTEATGIDPGHNQFQSGNQCCGSGSVSF